MTITPTRTGTVEHIDPNTVRIETNVRTGAAMKPVTPEFIDTIREHGVMQPVLGRRAADGTILVRAGQRRTLGAREAGVATIPVYIVDGDEETATRIIEQLIENDQRIELSDADRAAAWQQLAFEGLSVTKIAKRTGTTSGTVKTGLSVAASTTATNAITEHQLNLEQAATLIEFADDNELTNELIETAKTEPNQFEHVVQRARDERESEALRSAAETEVREQGFAILERAPYWEEKTPVHIRYITNADGKRLTSEEILGLDGASAYVSIYYRGQINVDYYLDDPTAHGFTHANSTQAANGPMNEEQKQERRTLIENNRAWASAETVRRAWLAEFLSRKTFPQDVDRVTASGLTTHRDDVQKAMQGGNKLAHELLSISTDGGWAFDNLSPIIEANPVRSRHITLAVVLGGIEAGTSKENWRYPNEIKASYLLQLAIWGYDLSEVEKIATTTQKQ